MKNWLLSLLISVLILVSHIHFWPLGTSLFVFAWLFFSDSFSALFLSMILDFAVETVFPVSVPIVSCSGSVPIAALRWALVLVLALIWESVVPPVLEGGDLVFCFIVILGLRLAVILDGRNRS
jgi:hypothetical protein